MIERKLSRAEAQAFLDLPDRSRTAVLRGMEPREREEALLVLVFALRRESPKEKERLAA